MLVDLDLETIRLLRSALDTHAYYGTAEFLPHARNDGQVYPDLVDDSDDPDGEARAELRQIDQVDGVLLAAELSAVAELNDEQAD